MKLDFSLGGFGGGGGRPADDAPEVTILDAPIDRGLDNAHPPVRTGLIVAGGFIGLLAVFAAVAPLSEAAVAPGEVMTSGDRILIQPEAAGVVSQFLVNEGQAVRAGQPLIRMNGVHSAAAAEQAQAKRDGLRALQARLIAERDRADAIRFPADLLSRASQPTVASALASQRAVFASQREVMSADRSIVDGQRTAAAAKRVAVRRQLALIRDELGGIRELYNKGLVRKTQLRALERSEAQLQAESVVSGGDVSKTALESARLINQQVLQTVNQLSQVEQELAQVDPALRMRQYDEARDVLRSPVAGRVAGVARTGQGAVLRPGQTVMEVVPNDRAMIVEARIKPGDIDDVRVGQMATLRFSTVNPHGRSDFQGKVVALSPAPTADQNGKQGFRAHIIATDIAALKKAGVVLSPGLPVSVQIRARDRTLLDYLLGPLTDGFAYMFREE